MPYSTPSSGMCMALQPLACHYVDGTDCINNVLFCTLKLHVLKDNDIHDCAIPDQASENYTSLAKVRPLSDSKCKHLEQMYRDFVPIDRRLDIT